MLVTGTAGTDAGVKLVTEQGAQHAVNHATAGYLDELMQLTGGRGFDLIIEMLANKNLQNDLGLLAKKGRVVIVGNRGMIEINPRDAMSREANLRGMMLSAASEAELREIHAALGTGLENGTLHPVIGTKIPLAEAPRAHEEIMKSSGALGKMVLTVG
jgi:NADPH2:quinone reductase